LPLLPPVYPILATYPGSCVPYHYPPYNPSQSWLHAGSP
jgi:hypothetical protein